MSLGVRHLTVLGEFKPFGLIAEALDGKPHENHSNTFNYSLFDPKITRQGDDYDSPASDSWNQCDHELFIRGNRIIWSAGSRVLKRYTLESSVIMACWCRLGTLREPRLCVLQVDSLTIYSVAGEVMSIPLPRTITSIWPLPCGLLLQKAGDGIHQASVPYSASSMSLNARDLPRSQRELGYSPQHNLNVPNLSDHTVKGGATRLSSHLIWRDPLEDLQTVFIEERGQFCPMKDFDERTIWTCDSIPLVASYNKGKMQHSLWLIETAPCNSEASNSKLHDIVPPGVLPKLFSFRRIWQGKGAPSAANKVLMATDDDGVPVICFLLHEQKGLLSLRLQAIETNSEILFDIKPDMSWCIPAIAAASVIVTRPRVKVGLLQFTDIIVLGLENNLLLYSGKKCLCRYILPSGLDKSFLLFSATSSDSAGTCNELKITGLDDSVDGRINVIVNNDQAQLWQLAQRTTALPIGRGAFTLATTSTLLTEALIVPKLVLAVRLPAQQNATV